MQNSYSTNRLGIIYGSEEGGTKKYQNVYQGCYLLTRNLKSPKKSHEHYREDAS